ncbi:MAG: ABC transporter permease [Gordonia sp. (in: high G+C Gram-positive bacteria)]
MTWYVLRRLGWLAASLVVASVVVFILLRMLPGDVATTIGGTESTPEQVAAIRSHLGLDRPLIVQYVSWIGDLLSGNLGKSALNGTSVVGELGRKAQVSVPLALGAIAISAGSAIPLGTWAAVRARRVDGAAVGAIAQIGIAIPSLWLALLLVAVFAVGLPLLPAQGFPSAGWSEPGAALRSLVLPWLALGLTEGAVLLRFVRSAVLGVLSSEFLTAARAAGNTRTRALVRHGFRNAAAPVIAVLGLQIAALLGGAVVVEQVFTLPGIGSMIVTDIANRDLGKVQGELILVVAVVITVWFIVDVIHRLIDPRLGGQA